MDKSLNGRRVLVVEDEYFIAQEVAEALGQLGAEVIGPVADTEAALSAIRDSLVHAAVLDLNIAGKLDFGIADELSRRGVPFVFATGYDAGAIPARFRHVVRVEKPYDVAQLVGELEAFLNR